MRIQEERGPIEPQGRILAVDLGARRIGLALSDSLQLTAQGLPTMERRSKRQNMNYLKSLVRRHDVSLILIGDPLNMDGSRGPAAFAAQTFAESLRRHIDVRVQLWDERLTSVEAEQRMRDSGTHPRDRAERVDQLAAVILLESYLETRRTRQQAARSRAGKDLQDPQA